MKRDWRSKYWTSDWGALRCSPFFYNIKLKQYGKDEKNKLLVKEGSGKYVTDIIPKLVLILSHATFNLDMVS